jgi:hypothetical protein
VAGQSRNIGEVGRSRDTLISAAVPSRSRCDAGGQRQRRGRPGVGRSRPSGGEQVRSK